MKEIIFIMGKSASGKDKIFKKIVNEFDGELKTVVMYTTRPMRVGEREGVEYHFVDDAEVEKLEQNGKIIELRAYNTINGVWKYFTVDDGQIVLDGKNRYIIIGTLEAYEKFVDFYGRDHFMPIYIEVDDDIRLERSIKRERKQLKPNYEELCRRFLADAKDFSEDNIKHAQINRRFKNNGRLEDCIEEIKQYIMQSK